MLFAVSLTKIQISNEEITITRFGRFAGLDIDIVQGTLLRRREGGHTHRVRQVGTHLGLVGRAAQYDPDRHEHRRRTV